ncbi:MAG TPA: agmatine deiminase family protein [Candidatus Deferrimicrobiaceae bacterium]
MTKAAAPASLGFRMPAEWESHEATWIGWPRNPSDWPGKFPVIPWVYGEIVRKVADGEIVRILVDSAAREGNARRQLSRAGADLSRVEFFRFPADRGWTRDFGPIFVRREAPSPEVAVVGFRFNAWARYPDWRKDARIHERAARALGVRRFPAETGGKRVVLEGGAIDVDGRGTLITTEECLLDQRTQVRNPGMTRTELEVVFRDYLGAGNAIWLGRGIAGDDTHGHVDDVCRFTGPGTVVLCREKDPNDGNYRPLEENRERLEGARLADGSRVEIVPLPMPAPLRFGGVRLPASYANFYISNAAVLVPTFNDPNDRVALGVLSELFRDRTVVGIHAVDLVWGFGTIHCLTQQQPAVC